MKKRPCAHCGMVNQPAPVRTDRLLRLGAAQFAVLLAGLATVALTVSVICSYDLYDGYARVAVRQFEQQYGFRTGRVLVPDDSGNVRETWGIAVVVSGGLFDRLGVRPGDRPFGYHCCGWAYLHDALSTASHGDPTEFEVVSGAGRSGGPDAVRLIIVPRGTR